MESKFELDSISHIFTWIGLSSIKFRKNARVHNCLLVLPIIVQVAVLLIELYLVLEYPNEFLYDFPSLAALTDLLQIYGYLFAGFVQIGENLTKGSSHYNLTASIKAYDRNMFAKHLCRNSKQCLFCSKRSLTARILIGSILIFFIGLFTDVVILTTIADERLCIWRQSIAIRTFSDNMIRLGVFQIACHFFWVSSLTNNINSTLIKFYQGFLMSFTDISL